MSLLSMMAPSRSRSIREPTSKFQFTLPDLVLQPRLGAAIHASITGKDHRATGRCKGMAKDRSLGSLVLPALPGHEQPLSTESAPYLYPLQEVEDQAKGKDRKKKSNRPVKLHMKEHRHDPHCHQAQDRQDGHSHCHNRHRGGPSDQSCIRMRHAPITPTFPPTSVP